MTIVEFPEQGAVTEEAAAWLVRLDADTPPAPEELQALGEWLQRSPAHREELEKLAALWGRLNVLTDLAVPLGNARPAVRTRDASASRQWLWSAGLLACVAIVLAAGAVLLARGPAVDPLMASNGLYVTAVGQQKVATLADGSQITLNTNSRIKVDYGEGYRQVYLLQGEALFTVAKNARRPFRVYAGNGRIEALGTAFAVYLNGADVDVMVTEGRVSLASGAAAEADELMESLGTLHAGQTAVIRSPRPEAELGSVAALQAVKPIAPEELAQRLAWREGVLVFSGEKLEDVVKELGRYTTVAIEIPDDAVRNMRIGGRFPVGETDTMLAALETNFHLRVTHLDANRVVLSAASQ